MRLRRFQIALFTCPLAFVACSDEGSNPNDGSAGAGITPGMPSTAAPGAGGASSPTSGVGGAGPVTTPNTSPGGTAGAAGAGATGGTTSPPDVTEPDEGSGTMPDSSGVDGTSDEPTIPTGDTSGEGMTSDDGMTTDDGMTSDDGTTSGDDVTPGDGSPTAFEEDTGLDCEISEPSGSNGASSSTLPDPFTKWDGTQVQTMADWRCRRRELVVETEKLILGTKAPPPHTIGGTVSGSISESGYSVQVDNPGGSTSFEGTVSLPNSGSAPYPAVIVIGGFNSLNPDVMESEGVATMSYNNNSIASEAAGNFNSGKYYEANPDFQGNTSALVAWAWGVSRIIDMLEQNPDVIDPTKIAVHGCSRLGKAAFVIGAFDQRIALSLPLEPGTGGPAPLRALPSLGGQSLESANGEASWFGPMSSSYSPDMPADMSDVAAMYAPRGLLLMDNPHIDHLAYKANYLGVAAAAKVYEAMGSGDAVWYLGNSDDGGHCNVRAEYGAPLRAMIQKFLKGDDSATTGGMDTHGNHGNIDVDGWTSSWSSGPISQ